MNTLSLVLSALTFVAAIALAGSIAFNAGVKRERGKWNEVLRIARKYGKTI